MRLILLAAAALPVAVCTMAACSQDTGTPRSSNGSLATSSSSGSSGTGAGGTGGSETGGAAGSGQGGMDAGTGGPTEAGAADPPCTNDLAYWALGMSFVTPTPQPLGQALSELAYDPLVHPISVILAAKGGVPSATIGISATADNGMGLQVFPAATQPSFVPALLSYGGFTTGVPQTTGILHLVDMLGPVDIELDNITVTMTTSSGCSNVLGALNAEIPTTEGGKILHLKAGNSTIGELGADSGGGGQKDAGPLPIGVRALFSGETMSFDFTSLK